MAYHTGSTQKTPSSTQETSSSTERPEAPVGYHYMPDGTLMSDAEHERLFNQPPSVGVSKEKIIRSFDLLTNDVVAGGESRGFNIIGDIGAGFTLEITNEDTPKKYYNFQTRAFQTTKTGLDETLTKTNYNGTIVFPKVTDDDQYDIYLFAKAGTKHVDYAEVRFADGSLDINSSTGSNSLLLQKVIYQYLDVTVTIGTRSPTSAITIASATNSTITTSRNKHVGKTPFTITASVAADKEIKINRTLTGNDVVTYIDRTIGSAPVNINDEDLYPSVSDTDTVDGDFSAATLNKIVMDNNVASNIVVGDKVTVATTLLTDTVDGTVSSGVKVVMDNNVVTKMAVGDRITSSSSSSTQDRLFDKTVVTVAALNPDGDNVKEFSMSTAMAIADGATLTFTPKCNRELFTVAALNPDGDNVKEFSVTGETDGLGILDGTTLSFSNRMNHRWPLDNVHGLREGMKAIATNLLPGRGTNIARYEDTVTVFEGEVGEYTYVKNSAKAIDTLQAKPTMSKGIVTAQTGNITFEQQQKLVLAGDAIRVYGYGYSMIESLSSYDITFSDLEVTLDTITTTTTAAVNNSTTIPVAEQGSIMDDISIMSGIGVNPAVVNPIVTNKAAATGAGNLTVSAAQTLESGVTLTFGGAGRVATIKGNIEINKVGNSSATFYFDLDKFLTSS